MLLRELQGTVSDKITLAVLKDLGLSHIPPLSVIHGNGRGYDAVAMAAMASDPPTGVQIHATDVKAMFLAELESTLAKNPTWPVKVVTMDACDLTFSDNTFNLSVATFVLAGLPDDVAALFEVWRTHAAYKILGADDLMPLFMGIVETKQEERTKMDSIVLTNDEN